MLCVCVYILVYVSRRVHYSTGQRASHEFTHEHHVLAGSIGYVATARRTAADRVDPSSVDFLHPRASVHNREFTSDTKAKGLISHRWAFIAYIAARLTLLPRDDSADRWNAAT